jgi:hypothetical protein
MLHQVQADDAVKERLVLPLERIGRNATVKCAQNTSTGLSTRDKN